MKDIKIPGFLWVVLIAVLVMLTETYAPSPVYVELGLLLLFGLAKAYNLGTQEIEELLTVLRRIDKGFGMERGRIVNNVGIDLETRTPNKVARWFVG